MSHVRGQKRHRAPRHGRLSVGTSRHTATGARVATSAHSHSVAGKGSDDRFRVDADGATGSRVETYAGHATDTDTGSGLGTGSGVGISSSVGPGEAGPGEAGPGEAGPGEAGPGEAGESATGGAGSGGGHVRRMNRHCATPWIVVHRGVAVVGAASVAALVVITAAIVGGGPRVEPPATGGGEWTTVPASSPAPAVPSAGVLSVPLSVPLPAASPTIGAGTQKPGRRAGAQGGRDRAPLGPKRSPGPPDRPPKQRPSR